MKTLPPTSRHVSTQKHCFLESLITDCEGLKIACIGRERCEADYLVDRPGFPCFGIEFVASGIGHLTLNRHSFPLHAGVAFCYGPELGHRIVNTSGLPMIKYFVDFFGEGAEELLNNGKFNPGCALQVIDVESVTHLFDQLIHEGDSVADEAKEIRLAYLKLIVLKAATGVAPSVENEDSGSARFQQWRKFIDLNFIRLRDLEDVARELRTRPAQLCRVFKQYGQPGPFQYLTRKKLNRAAELLASRHHSVKEVSIEVGYPDPYHFSRLFKKQFGRSPSEFRSQLWRNSESPLTEFAKIGGDSQLKRLKPTTETVDPTDGGRLCDLNSHR